jgi:hypothetical protein
MSQRLSRFHLNCITHGGTTMNSEERQSIEGKRREERKTDQFLKRNHVDERRQTLISLSSLVFPVEEGGGGCWLCRGCAIRKRKGHGGKRENRDASMGGYCSRSRSRLL